MSLDGFVFFALLLVCSRSYSDALSPFAGSFNTSAYPFPSPVITMSVISRVAAKNHRANIAPNDSVGWMTVPPGKAQEGKAK